MNRSATAHIDLQALQHNLAVVKQYAPNSKIMCALKANAYGHGLLQSAQALKQADGFAVAHINEAIALRESGIGQAIWVLQGPRDREDLRAYDLHNLTAIIHHESQLAFLDDAEIQVLLKVNTGMNRLGFAPEQLAEALRQIEANKRIQLLGLFTHLADADYADQRDTTDRQVEKIAELNLKKYPLSIANSAGLIHWPKSRAEWVRPGIMLYGVNPFTAADTLELDLQAVMTLTAPIIAINQCKQGDKVGYGGTWEAKRDTRLAVIAIGYGDGYPRHAKVGTPVLINGHEYPLVGRVSMDLITVDITESQELVIGAEAILWGAVSSNSNPTFGKKTALPVEKIAECADTIAYELLCSIYGRVSYQFNK